MQSEDDQRTLPPTRDEIDACARSYAERLRASLAPAGQLVLPVAALPAQLGLDGLAYEPRRPERALSATVAQGADLDADSSGRSPDESARYLGTSHNVLPTGDLHHAPGPLLGQLPLALDLDRLDDSPQLSVWGRLDVARELLARGDFDRDAKCMRTRYRSGDVSIARHDSASWSIGGGVIRCGVWQTCPSCGPRKCRETASKLGVAIARHLEAGNDHDVWMLSPTIPHHADVPTAAVVDQLYAAHHAFLRSSEWRRFAKRWGVIGAVRVLDATHGGANGSHPHFHIAVFVTRAGLPTSHAFALSEQKPDGWTIDPNGGLVDGTEIRVLPSQIAGFGVWTALRTCDQQVREKYLDEIAGSLVTAWERAVRASGARIENRTEFLKNALRLSPSEKAASYFVKWGLADEVGAPVAKARNHLRLLDAVAAQVKGAAHVFKLWRRAIEGHALVTGLGDLCARLGVTDDDARAYLDALRVQRELKAEREGTPIVKVPELRLVVRSHVYAVAMALGWERVFAFVDEESAKGRGDAPDWLQRELDAFLWRHMDLARTRDTS